MPKPKSEVWEHFQELEKKQGSKYPFVRCKGSRVKFLLCVWICKEVGIRIRKGIKVSSEQ